MTVQADFPKSLWSSATKKSTFIKRGPLGIADDDLNLVSFISPICESACPVSPTFAWIIARIHVNCILAC